MFLAPGEGTQVPLRMYHFVGERPPYILTDFCHLALRWSLTLRKYVWGLHKTLQFCVQAKLLLGDIPKEHTFLTINTRRVATLPEIPLNG
jgi:hypothetical protein